MHQVSGWTKIAGWGAIRGMSEPLIVQTLKQQRAEILGQIKAYEAQIAHAKHDLAHVNATIELFAAPERQRARYIVSHGFFKKGEIAHICVRHLSDGAEMTTRELAERVMIERDLDHGHGAAELRGVQGRPGAASRQAPQARAHGGEAARYVRLVSWRRSHAARRCQ